MQTNILNPDPEKMSKSIIITQELPTGVLVNMRQLNFFFSKFTLPFCRYRRRCQKSRSPQVKNCFLHFSTKMAEIQNMSLANENTLKNEHFMPLDHFSNFSHFHDTHHFNAILEAFIERQNQRGRRKNLIFSSGPFRRPRRNLNFGGIFVSATLEKMTGIGWNIQIFCFFLFFLVDFSEFQGISYFPIEKYLVLRSYIMKNIVPNNIEEMSGNSICQETPRKHPGNTRERCIY